MIISDIDSAINDFFNYKGIYPDSIELCSSDFDSIYKDIIGSLPSGQRVFSFAHSGGQAIVTPGVLIYSGAIKCSEGRHVKIYSAKSSSVAFGAPLTFPKEYFLSPIVYIDLSDKKCECGSLAVGSNKHSSWCQLNEQL